MHTAVQCTETWFCLGGTFLEKCKKGYLTFKRRRKQFILKANNQNYLMVEKDTAPQFGFGF